jgi:type I restriction enzyme S subunit
LKEKINQTLEEIANTLFKSWFVNFDPVKSKEAGVSIGLSKDISDLFTDSYKDSTFGKIPQSWKVSKFGELLTPKRGKIITKKMITSGEIPVVAGGINPAYYHSKSNAKSPIVTISASGNAGYVNLFYKDIWASDCSYINKDVTDFIYFSYSFLKINQNKIFHLKHGAVQQHINPKDLMGLDIVLPPISLISKYEQIVTPLHNKISNNLNEINTLSSLRDLLLPKLISGELKVTDSQKLIDEVSV